MVKAALEEAGYATGATASAAATATGGFAGSATGATTATVTGGVAGGVGSDTDANSVVTEALEGLLEHDQLTRERMLGRAFPGFLEGDPPPHYHDILIPLINPP